jgi:surface antigen
MRKEGILVHIFALKKPIFQTITISAAALIFAAIFAPIAAGLTYQQKIDILQKRNSNNESARSDLQANAETLQQRVNSLRAEINAVESQIADSERKREALLQEIKQVKIRLAREKKLLGSNIKAMYIDNDMSTIEMLASSKNLSEYLDRDQYRISVQDKITKAMERIEVLKNRLNKQKIAVEKLLEDQKSMRRSLADKTNEVARLLGLNKAEQRAYNSQISSNNKRIGELQRLQAIENQRHNVGSISYSGSGGYPWANVPFPNSMPDPWGMYKRQCVSYTAWKVASTGRHMPYWGGRGNANEWDDNARAAGMPVSYTPKAGSVAVSNSGTWGHVMYVERVHSDGTITVSQYNAGWDGRYSVVRRSTYGLVFIYF